MTKEQFSKWKKNGNLQLAKQEIYESLANDLAENMKLSQRNLLELAKYLQLSLVEENNKRQMLKLDVLDFALKLNKL